MSYSQHNHKDNRPPPGGR